MPAVIGFREVGPGRFTILTDRVAGIVGEFAAGFQARELTHHAVAFDYDGFAVPLLHHPFPRFHRDGDLGEIPNRDKIDKGKWPVCWGVEARHIHHVVYGDFEAGQFTGGRVHK